MSEAVSTKVRLTYMLECAIRSFYGEAESDYQPVVSVPFENNEKLLIETGNLMYAA